MNLEKALKVVLDKYSIKKDDVVKYCFLSKEDGSFPNDNCTLFVVLKNGQKIFEDFSGGIQNE